MLSQQAPPGEHKRCVVRGDGIGEQDADVQRNALGILPSSSGRAMSIACDNGRHAATTRSVAGICSTGKKMPESSSIGVSTNVKKYVKKS